MRTVLVLLAEGFEEIETIAPVDLLRRAGAKVTLAALAEGIHVVGRCGMVVHADTVLAAVENHDFDCVVLPGGPGTSHLRRDPRVKELVLRQHRAGRSLAAICAAPTVLHDAGLLAGKKFTAHHSVAAELPALLANEKVVLDANILTSRGAGTALEFGLALIELLFGVQSRQDIAKAICF